MRCLHHWANISTLANQVRIPWTTAVSAAREYLYNLGWRYKGCQAVWGLYFLPSRAMFADANSLPTPSSSSIEVAATSTTPSTPSHIIEKIEPGKETCTVSLNKVDSEVRELSNASGKTILPEMTLLQ